MNRIDAEVGTSVTPELFVELHRVHGLLLDEIACLLRGRGVSEPQYNVLRILGGAGPEGLPCRRIGERMLNRVPDVTRLLDRLEAAGLVGRERSRRDRRVVSSVLTSAGRRLLAELDAPVAAVHAAQFAGLSRNEFTALGRILRKVRTAAEARAPERSS